MKLYYDQVFSTLDGNPILDDQNPPQPLTLVRAIIIAAGASLPGDEAMNPLEKYALGELAVTAHKGLDLTSGQIVKVKERVTKVFGNAILIYMLYEALEGNNNG